MRAFTITITGMVDESATLADIERMAGDAAVQVQEPTDEDGEDVDFETAGVTYTIDVNER